MPSEVSSVDGEREERHRKRSSAFTPLEKTVLLRLVQAKKEILNSRQADFSTIKRKQQAWADIAADFCSHSGVTKRTPFQLKKFWNNSKRKTKDTTKGRRQRSPVPELHCEIHVNSVSTHSSEMKALDNDFECDNDIKPEDGTGHEVNGDCNAEMSDALRNVSTELREEIHHSKNEETNRVQSNSKVQRTSLVDMEYEEHKMRLKVLLVNYETEMLKKQLAEEQLKMAKEEHLMKVQLIAAQLMRASGN